MWILGAGAFASGRLPLGLSHRLSNIETVFTIIREPINTWLPVELRRTLNVVCLVSEFSNFGDRLDNYKRIAQKVVDAATSGKDVVYLTYGSPVVFDRVTGLIQLECTKTNLPCTLVPSTSSVDALLAYIGEDMAPGLQICEARWLVQRAIQLDPRLSVLLFQIGVFWTDGIVQETDLNTTHLSALQEYLLKYFPIGHPALFVRAPFTLLDEGYFNCRPLERLVDGVSQDLSDTSLYLPSISDVDRSYKRWWRRFRERS